MKKIKTNLVEFHDLTLEESAEWVANNSIEDGFKYVVTPNVDHLARLLDNTTDLMPIYESADLCLCDSRILKIMFHKKGYPLESVVPGSDLTATLFSKGYLENKKTLVFGGDNEIFNTLKGRNPTLDLHHINPSMGFIKRANEVEALIDEVKQLNPDVLFLAVGSPQQEKFAYALQTKLNHGVALCIGASILFITGEEKRAPVIFQKLHIEWLFRMIVAPRLIKRYWQNFLTLGRLYKSI
ncbi:WecB/TagA/CpsF family glycosyltransferase [Glaciecola sp. 2405UD65-10]|uniref:WecB/TagA/CpsF family glycosyltransferase n=1 Tax=Glaciecola sp. 2405UD65-10 TaxID=3397244 RepID=UPI003B5BD013